MVAAGTRSRRVWLALEFPMNPSQIARILVRAIPPRIRDNTYTS